MRVLVTLLFALSLAAGCGADNGPQGSTGGGGATAAGSGTGVPGDKGEPCMQDSDCAAPYSKCRQGNICTGSLGGDAFETECTTDTAGDCAGVACIAFPASAAKTGICSLPCAVDA